MTAERPSTGAKVEARHWRSVIRILALTGALLGLVLIANEIFENVTCDGVAVCAKIHLGTMLWGITLLSLGLLILQKGDVSLSLKEAAETGTIVRDWFRKGRQTDAPGTVVKTTVVPPIELPPPKDDKDETVERPKYPLGGI